jgi:hypothetical protein
MSRRAIQVATSVTLALLMAGTSAVAIAAPAPVRALAPRATSNYACTMLTTAKAQRFVPNAKLNKASSTGSPTAATCAYTKGGSKSAYVYGAAVAMFGPSIVNKMTGTVDEKIKKVLAAYNRPLTARKDLGSHVWYATWKTRSFYPQLMAWYQNKSIVVVLMIVPVKSKNAVFAVERSIRAHFKTGHMK